MFQDILEHRLFMLSTCCIINIILPCPLNIWFPFDSGFTRIFKFGKAHLLSNLIHGRKWVSIYHSSGVSSSNTQTNYLTHCLVGFGSLIPCKVALTLLCKPNNSTCDLPWNYFMWNVLQVYFWVISSNLILRCTWTYKLSSHLRHNYLTVFAITALEIFRRFQWVFFRVENEWNKMNSKSNIQLSMSDTANEEERLLVSNGHNV